jgi:ATP-dependent Clp protease ATP-binding subunit ClpB
MDDGRLTDSHGRTVDFRNTVIVMTSNLGSDRIQEALGGAETFDDGAYEKLRRSVLDVVVRHFSPEFVNRIDETVVFHPLQTEQIRAIAELQVQELNRRLEDRELKLTITAGALDRLAEIAYDPVYGARPLKRAIQARLENPLAKEMLKGAFKPGSIIRVDLGSDGELSFDVASVH